MEEIEKVKRTFSFYISIPDSISPLLKHPLTSTFLILENKHSSYLQTLTSDIRTEIFKLSKKEGKHSKNKKQMCVSRDRHSPLFFFAILPIQLLV